MPDHLHALIDLEDGQMGRFLRRFKSNATNNIDVLMRGNDKALQSDWLCEKGKRELWQDGKHSIPIYSSKWIKQKINYLHRNPVTKGLVENPADYIWSSFGAYEPTSGHEPPVFVDVAEVW